jgi:predicted transcriptional regulator
MKGACQGDKFMPSGIYRHKPLSEKHKDMSCPFQQGWRECAEAKKKERKMLEQIIHLAKKLITLGKADKEKVKEIFGPLIVFLILLYSLTGIAAMFYNK